MTITPAEIRAKFGGDYVATAQTFRLGIGRFFSRHLAERFRGRRVLETCTGAGFCTIALAEVAEHVTTVEIDPDHQKQASVNVGKAGLLPWVTFFSGDVLADGTLDSCGRFDAAFLDPDWAVTGPEHVYRFRRSNMRPPADVLLAKILERIDDVALILPPSIAEVEFDGLPQHECEILFLDGSRELFCLYFGSLMQRQGFTDWHACANQPFEP
jgi:hypothetical protein